MIRPPPRSPLFPSTPLSRSCARAQAEEASRQDGKHFLRARVRHGHTGDSRRRGEARPTRDYLRRPAGYGGNRFGNGEACPEARGHGDRKSTRLNSSHGYISYAVFCLKKKKKNLLMLSVKLHQLNDDYSSAH